MRTMRRGRMMRRGMRRGWKPMLLVYVLGMNVLGVFLMLLAGELIGDESRIIQLTLTTFGEILVVLFSAAVVVVCFAYVAT